MEIAVRLRRVVREQVGLPITVGIARTKFLAKVASGVAKPDGLLVVPPGGELAFLQPLPVERLWGVGPVTAGTLRRLGIVTVGQSMQILGVQSSPSKGIGIQTWGRQKSGRIVERSNPNEKFRFQFTWRSTIRIVPGAIRSTFPPVKVALAE